MYQPNLDHLLVGFVEVDEKGQITLANRAARSILDLKVDETNSLLYSDRTWQQIDVYGESLPLEEFPLTKALHGHIVQDFVHGIRAGNELKWLRVNACPIIENDQVIGAHANFSDITDIVESEKALRRQNEDLQNFRSVIDQNAVIIIADKNRLIKDINGKWESIIGQQPNPYIGSPILEPFHFQQGEKLLAEQSLADNQSWKGEAFVKDSMNQEIWFDISITPMKTGKGKIYQYIAIAYDITDSRLAAQQAKRNEKRLESLVEQGSAFNVLLDHEYRVVYADKASREFLESNTDQSLVSISRFTDMLTPQLKNELTAALEEVEKYGYVKVERELFGRWLYMTGSLIQTQDGQKEYLISSFDITKRKRYEFELKSIQEKQRVIFDSLPSNIAVINREGVIIDTNKAWDDFVKSLRLQGLSLGDNYQSLLQNNAKEGDNADLKIANKLSAILKRETSFYVTDYKLIANDFTYWFQLRLSAMHSQEGGAVISLHNITQRMKAELQSKNLLQDLKSIYDDTPAMLFSFDEKGIILNASRYFYYKLNYQPEAIIGQSLISFFSQESLSVFDLNHLTNEGAASPIAYDLPLRWRTGSGQYIDVLFSAVHEKSKHFQGHRFMAVLVDVSSLKKTQEKLKKSQKSLLEAQKIGQLGNFSFDVTKDSWSGSQVLYQLLGWEDKKAKTINGFLQLVNPNDRFLVEKLLYNGTTNNAVTQYFKITRQSDNQERIVQLIGQYKSTRGKLKGLTGTLQDVTDTREKERDLQLLHHRLEIATESAKIGVWEYHYDDDKIYWNDTQKQIFKLPKGQEKDLHAYFKSVVHPDDQYILRMFDKDKILNTPRDLTYDFRVLLGNRTKTIKAYARYIVNQAGEPQKVVGINMDITDQKDQEDILRHSIEQKNTLIKEVHHRVKNNMQLISSILSMKSIELKDQDAKRVFNESNEKIKAMALVHDKLYQMFDVQEINLKHYLKAIINDLSMLYSHKQHESIVMQGDDLEITLDKALSIGLIVNEIVVNAYKHGMVEVAEPEIVLHLKEEEDYVVLKVKNNGKKLPDDILENSRQSGLGVAIMKNFAADLKGQLSVINTKKYTGYALKFPYH